MHRSVPLLLLCLPTLVRFCLAVLLSYAARMAVLSDYYRLCC